MVATGSKIIHESNFEATDEVEIMVGSDRIIRINIDGHCALRVRLKKTCQGVLDDVNGVLIKTSS